MRHGFSGFALAVAALGVPQLAQAAAPAPACDCIDYPVRRGDTLFTLAQRYMTGAGATREVQALNRVADPRHLPIGRHIDIPRRLLRFVPVELRVLGFSGAVVLAARGRSAPVARGMVVGEGAELKSAANAFLTLEGSDGSRIALPSNSRIRVVRARRYVLEQAGDIEVEVLDGRAEISAAPQRPQGRFRMRTPVSVSAVRGTVFRIAYGEAAGASGTEVIEGHVAVATAARGVEVPGGFGASADRLGNLAKEALLPPPQRENPGLVQVDPELAFGLRPLPGARAYRLQVSRDAGFTEVIGAAEAPTPQVAMAGLPNGNYFLRATAVAASGLEGMPEITTFRRQRVGLTGQAGASGVADGFRFNWRAEGEGTSLFRFQLFPAKAPQAPLVDEAGLTEPGLTLSALPPGAYAWRVGVIQTTPEGSAEVWTPPTAFSVSN